MNPREFILSRFRLASAKKRGGVSSAQIFGKAADKLSHEEIEAALKALREEGVLAYTSGLWWKR